MDGRTTPNGNDMAARECASASVMQDALLRFVRLKPAAPIHTTVALELIGQIDRRSLRAALDHVVYRHKILRTVFRSIGRASKLVVGAPDRGLALVDQDVDNEREALSLLREETRVPFDVLTGPLIRARLLQVCTTRYFLFISVHPLVCDHGSLSSILREVRDLYGAFSQNRANTLPPASQYADYARNQIEAVPLGLLQEQLDYWKRQLLGAQDLMHLPTDRPRPAMCAYSTQKHRLELSTELTEGLRELASCGRVAPSAVLIGGWVVLLNRWTGQDDMTIGVSVSNRSTTSVDCTVGPFENTLPIRVAIFQSTTVSALLAQIDVAFSAAITNKDIPIHTVIESLRPLRGARPIIQTSISITPTSLNAALGGHFGCDALEVVRVWDERYESALELSISVFFENCRLVAMVEYARDLFERSTIERICDWWLSLLSAMVNAPNSRVSRLPMLTAADRGSLIREFNGTPFSRLPPQRIDDVLESYAEQTPESVAVMDGRRAISFFELNGRANQLARVLKRRDLRRGELVAVAMDSAIEAIIAVIAVLKAGGAYIAGTPAEFQWSSFCTLRSCAPRIFILTARAELASRGHDSQIISFDMHAEEIGNESTSNLQRSEATALDVACVISSTDRSGRRHWTVFDHRNVTSMVSSLDERLHFTRLEVWSLAHTLMSRTALVELWGALLTGSKLTVVPADVRKDPEDLHRFLVHERITVLNQTRNEFIRWAEIIGSKSVERLHTLILSGDSLRVAALRGWFDVGRRWPQIIYLYGYRGSVLAGAYAKVTRLDVFRRSRGWLAVTPLSGSRFYVLDRHCQPVPIGVIGDVYVAGDSVGRGYAESGQRRKRRSRTLLAIEPDLELYRTGDRGFWTPDAQIELILSKDAAVGLGAEALRLEDELLLHPSISNASVVARLSDTGSNSFVAYVDCSYGEVCATELQAYLEARVPTYMVPKEFICRARAGSLR